MGQIDHTKFKLPRHGYRNMTLTRRFEQSGPLRFKDYIMKFHPNVVFNRIEKRKRAEGLETSVKEDFNEIYEGIDPTDELLRLNLDSLSSGRRKWRPSGTLNTEAMSKDTFSLRHRLFELMRHTVYRTRNKLVIMQVLREKYRNSSLFKMGLLISKMDTACKSFAAFNYRLLHACVTRQQGHTTRHEVLSFMTGEERLLNKWFEIDLLIDLVQENDKNAKETVEKFSKGRKEKWKFID
ncbi:uncharacterized protein LOC114363699 [Ostrinia furnacalis]|uniref:uncharacterized protein LOC114363699 n=1 Tax=Ostrinia furnacalis TaxID=93504 RepID=UPI00103F24A9|nr:uncharacterized protein LOC114363699 [Ostrinia furnacalis]